MKNLISLTFVLLSLISFAQKKGDGNIETGLETNHTYSSAGEYYIRLGITDGEGEEEGRRASRSRPHPR